MARIRAATLLAASIAALAAGCANAQDRRSFDIPPEDLSAALRLFARQSGVAIVASPTLVGGRRSPGTTGEFEPERALGRLLAGTGFRAELVDGAFVITRDGTASLPTQDIVVTGTRIRGAAPIGSPVTVVDRAAIEKSGRATIAELIQTLPQNFNGGENEATAGNSSRGNAVFNTGFGSSINLRGLGASSTLTLLDGNRPALAGSHATFSDVSLIPSIAIDRIEVLSDGASAIYGSDAVAGVVNLRFRNDYQGLEARLYSGTAGGSFGEYQAAVIGGHRWDSGGFMVAYEYNHRGRLAGDARPYATQDLSRYGGPDDRSQYALPATIVGADGSMYAADRVGSTTTPLTASDLIEGASNLRDEARKIDLLPRQETHTIYAAADRQFSSNLSVFSRLLFARRRFDAAIAPFDEPVTVSSDNPYYVDPIGTGEPIMVERDFSNELGDPHQSGTVTGLNATAGLTGNLGRWHVDALGGFGRQHESSILTGLPNLVRLADAGLASEPAAALNPFGPDDPSVRDAIRGRYQSITRYTVWTSALRLDGPLLTLPAGEAKLAVGAEYRHERFTGREIDDLYTSPILKDRLPDTPRERHITSQYAELSVPVFRADHRFPGRLDLSLAGRIEQYSDVGSTRNPKFGASWQPLHGLTLRGSYGTSFRAPGLFENPGDAQNVYFGLLLPDPASPTGQTAVIENAGHAAHIRPERATTWTTGVDVQPDIVPGLRLTATWFDIRYRDRIDTAAYNLYSFLVQRNVYAGLIEENPSADEVARYFSSSRFLNYDGITAAEVGAIVDGTYHNLSRTHVRGFDFDISYSHAVGGGTAVVGVNGTRLIAVDQQATPDSAPLPLVSTYASPVRLRMRGHAGWRGQRFDANAYVNYTSSYRNTIFTPAPRVSAWTTLDVSAGWTVPRAGPFGPARLGLSVTNLLDRKPPYIANVVTTSVLGYDPSQASAVGREIALTASFSL